MKISFLLHSTTGNTRLVTRFAASYLRSRGHVCEVLDVVERPDPDVGGVDLIGVAAPTMYLRPSFTIERAVARLPNAGPRRRPAFLINTCSGLPGAHFAVLAETLRYKGYVTLGAYAMIAPSNWPPQVAAHQRLAVSEPLSLVASFTPRSARWLWALLWERVCHPDEQDRDALVVFLDDVVAKAEAGSLDEALRPAELHAPVPMTAALGRMAWPDLPDQHLGVHIDPLRCAKCGTCVEVCSERIITRAGDEVPVIGPGCAGCYACFNHCPEGAISDRLTTDGVGQYRAPPRSMRELFRWPR